MMDGWMIIYWYTLHNVKNTTAFFTIEIAFKFFFFFYSRIEKANNLQYIDPDAFQNLPNLQYL